MSTQTAVPTKSAAKPEKKPAMNLFTGVGRLGQDPTMRYSGEGRAWTTTSLAIFQGEDKDPIWLKLKAFAKPLDKGGWDESVPIALAEVKKGQKISVRGKLFCDKHEHKGKEYVDWGLVLYNAPTLVVDEPKNGANTESEPD